MRRAKAPTDVKHAYGIGQYMNPRIVRDVKAAIQQILDRAKGDAVEARSLGIVKKDLEGMQAALAAIKDADTVQEQRRASAPGGWSSPTTRGRARISRRWAQGRRGGGGARQGRRR